jgi:hypothetical protein
MQNALRKIIVVTYLGGMGLLAGCQTGHKNLYDWGSYQPQVYQYFKGESPEKQIDMLEKDLQLITAKGAMPPPGMHAHLGLLYSQLGREELVVQHFEAEKKLFPESTAYMDFLLKKSKKGVN